MRAFHFIFLLFWYSAVSAQIVASKEVRISRTISMPEVYAKKTSDSLLLSKIVAGVQSGAIHAYADSGLTHKLSFEEVDSIVHRREYVDTFLFPHPESREESMVLITREGSFFETRTFRLLLERDPLKFIALGIDRECSLPEFRSDLGVPAPYKNKKTLLWLPYNQVRSLLYERDAVTNGRKFSGWISGIIAELEAGH